MRLRGNISDYCKYPTISESGLGLFSTLKHRSFKPLHIQKTENIQEHKNIFYQAEADRGIQEEAVEEAHNNKKEQPIRGCPSP